MRERYLRDDVSCGIHSCRECASTSTSTPSTLPSSGSLEHTLFPNGHFVLPDTNVFLSQVPHISNACRTPSLQISQMDLIESSLFTPPVILLQTVMEEVRHRSLPLYNRLKALTKADDKQTWIFYNEFRSYVTFYSRVFSLTVCALRETAVVREEEESPNDRNDRGSSRARSP